MNKSFFSSFALYAVLAAKRFSRSSAIDLRTPLSTGNEIQGLLPLPIKKTYDKLDKKNCNWNLCLNKIWFLNETKKKHIPSGEGVVGSVLDVDDVERAWMSFARGNGTNTTQIVTAGDHDQVARVELDVILDFVVLQVQAECVVDLDVRVGVTESAAVVGDQHWHTLGAD